MFEIEHKRYFGRLIFPTSNEVVKDIWLYVSDSMVYLEVPKIYHLTSQWDVLHGEFTGLDKVTLLWTYPSGNSSGFGGVYSKLIVGQLVSRIFLKDPDDLFISKFSFQWPSLNKNWIFENLSIGQNSKERTFTIPERIQILNYKNLAGWSISVNLGHGYHYNSKNVNINQQCWVVLEFASPSSIAKVKELIIRLERLLVLISGVAPDYFDFFINNEYPAFWTSKKVDEKLYPATFQVDYPENKINLNEICRNWFQDKTIQQISDLLLEKYYHPHLWRNRYLLNLIVGLESLHKNYVKRKKTPLSSRLKEYQDVFERLGAERIFHLSINELCEKIKNTRDSLAHNGVYEVEFSEGVEAIVLEFLLRLTLQIKISEKLGVNLEPRFGNCYEQAKALFHAVARNNQYTGYQEKSVKQG